MIYQTIDNASQFRDQFHLADRGYQFSCEALGLLFDFLKDSGEDVELDVICICCDFSEDTPELIASNYSIDTNDLDEDEIKRVVFTHLEDKTFVVGETSFGSIVYKQF